MYYNVNFPFLKIATRGDHNTSDAFPIQLQFNTSSKLNTSKINEDEILLLQFSILIVEKTYIQTALLSYS